ncbi:hypothetical protein [Streptomyces sp. NPDC049881]|uniref:hypothetical protein n=1 Tax=Streptomyces sp. NPDC049881 TaxID=3155778 RepID=UPI0034493A34
MRDHRRARRLVVGDTLWWWSVRHDHHPPACREKLSLRRDGTFATLCLVFPGGPGRIIADGLSPGGTVGGGSLVLNLHRPGVARRFLDAALADGLMPTARGATEHDGWALFDTFAAAVQPWEM